MRSGRLKERAPSRARCLAADDRRLSIVTAAAFRGRRKREKPASSASTRRRRITQGRRPPLSGQREGASRSTAAAGAATAGAAQKQSTSTAFLLEDLPSRDVVTGPPLFQDPHLQGPRETRASAANSSLYPVRLPAVASPPCPHRTTRHTASPPSDPEIARSRSDESPPLTCAAPKRTSAPGQVVVPRAAERLRADECLQE